jgi:hypothetical protein
MGGVDGAKLYVDSLSHVAILALQQLPILASEACKSPNLVLSNNEILLCKDTS